MDVFDMISPVDNRYYDEEAAKYLSEKAFVEYKLKVELGLIKALKKTGFCTDAVYKEVEQAVKAVTPLEIAEEEKKTKHDIRALVNCLKNKVSDKAKPFIHMLATSYDIVGTANALRYSDFVKKLFVPEMIKLEEALIDLALREADTVQIGRTHRQHAIPITFGFAVAQYVDRLGQSIDVLQCMQNLPGKFSGAVGAYNAASLLLADPEQFEVDLLSDLGTHPAGISTQIVQPEQTVRLFSEVVLTTGIMANLADNIRGLQATEVDEVREPFADGQVGSSTMPQKRNPIISEGVKSLWKVDWPRISTLYMDQISEYERDLTNSASSRTYAEIFVYALAMVKRLTKVVSGLTVNREKMASNLSLEGDLLLAEPMYIVLSSLGHPNAHEKVRLLAEKARKENLSLYKLSTEDKELEPYFKKMKEAHKKVLSDVKNYTGLAASKAKAIAGEWKENLKLYKLPDAKTILAGSGI